MIVIALFIQYAYQPEGFSGFWRFWDDSAFHLRMITDTSQSMIAAWL